MERSSPCSEALLAAVDELADASRGASGFGNITMNHDACTVVVRWKGEPPDAVVSLLGDRDGVTVTLLPADYSEVELLAATRRLLAAFPPPIRAELVTVAGAGQNREMSGLIVDVTPVWDGSDADLAAAAGVPVETELVSGPAQTL